MKFVLLINLKLLTIAISFLLNIAEHENFSANEYKNANYCWFLFDLGLTSLSPSFSHIATMSGCGSELSAHF